MISIKEILQGLKTQVSTVCSTVYTQERPTATDQSLTAFVVVSLPVSLRERIEGAVYNWWTDTTVQFGIYVKDKATASNPNQMNIPRTDSLVDGIIRLFPFSISGTDITYNVVKPEIIYVGKSDDNGFHITLIQAILTTI